MKNLVFLLLLGVVTSAYAAALKINGTDNGKHRSSGLTSTVMPTKEVADLIQRSIHAQLASLSTEQRERVLATMKEITTKIGEEDSDEYFMTAILTTVIGGVLSTMASAGINAALG